MKTTLPILAALALAIATAPAASACPTCARHNPVSTGEQTADGHEHAEHGHEHAEHGEHAEGHEHGEHGHEHADVEEGFMTILGPGHTEGWSFDPEWIRIEDGTIIAGSMERDIPAHRYAVYEQPYYNFELRLEVKIEGPERSNGGIQIRSENRGGTDMAGYQADMGFRYWGRIYDQSRRNSLLSEHPAGFVLADVLHEGDWNDYVIRAEGPHIQIWINGVQTADYTEANEELAAVTGLIGLQLHTGPPSLRYYRNIRIHEIE